MAQINHVKEVIDNFLLDENTSVLVLKGGWGVGKTFFWKKYIEHKIQKKELKHVAYSYLSLFGLNDLKETRSKIFQKGIPLRPTDEMQKEFEESEKEQNKMLNLVPAIINLAKNNAPRLGFLSRLSKEIPYFNQAASIITTMEYGLIKNYLICFDDLERKGDNLNIKEVMGLIDELVTEKKCKVLLIFNEASLSEKNEDKKQFEIYREKIVDVEIEYKPTTNENIALIFAEDEPQYKIIEEVFTFLNVSNIRIYKKTKWAIDRIKPSISHFSLELQEELIKHLIVFSWSYYNNADTLLPLIKVASKIKRDSWVSSLINPKENPSPEDVEWDMLASNLALSGVEYDDHLVLLLTEGYIDRTSFEEVLETIDNKKHQQEVAAKLRIAWDIYSNSFKDNLSEFLDIINDLIKEEIEYLKLFDFANAIDVLEEYGQSVEGYVDSYLKAHTATLSKYDIVDRFHGHEIRNERLKAGILELTKSETESNLSIDKITEKIGKIQGWNPIELAYLDALSAEEIFSWMMSNPVDLRIKVIDGLLFFRELSGTNEIDTKTYRNIAYKTEQALLKVSKTTALNKKRVELFFGINLESILDKNEYKGQPLGMDK